MPVKVSVFFEGNERTCGWSETLYDSASALTAIPAKVATWITKRLACAPSSVTIKGWRANVIGSRGTSRSATLSSDNTGTFNGEDHMTEPWSALLIRLSNGDVVRVSRFMHGIPQSQVTGGTYTPTLGFLTPLNALMLDYQNNWSIYARNPAIIGSPKQIYTTTVAAPERLTSHQIGRPFDLLVGRRPDAA